MDSVDYVEQSSGAAGFLAVTANACHGLNGTMTKMLDQIHGPEGTDTFDASCNTCAHFQRTTFDRKTHNPAIFGFPGRCGKFDKMTLGWPRGQFCGFENAACYENRRTGEKPEDIHRKMKQFMEVR